MRPLRHLLLILSLFAGPAVAAAQLQVSVGVLPLKTIVQRIGGQHVAVSAMVGQNHDPHTYDPSPQQIASLARAALYIRSGMPFEDAWMSRLLAVNPHMRVLDAHDAVERQSVGGTAPAPARVPPHGAHAEDPHVWTSPSLVRRRLVARIRDALSALEPAHTTEFALNAAAFEDELDRLDREIRTLLAPLTQRRFLVFHPAWGHFADAYDLIQVAIEQHGKEPGARSLAMLIDDAKRHDIRVVFVQPQGDRRLAAQIAHAIGGDVITVDPLAPDYVPNLRRVARQFAEVLQR